MSSSPKIAAAICTYQRYDLLSKAIMSACKQSLSREVFEIIVVDNSPDYKTSVAASREFDRIENLTWIYEPTPGLSNARNVAAGETKADIIAYLDDDAIAEANWLEGYISAFEYIGAAACTIGGKISPIWEVARPAWLSDRMLGHLSVVDLGNSIRLLEEHEWLAGANIAFSREQLIAAGGFDTALGRKGIGYNLLSNEEIALIEKLKSAGGLVAYTPHASIHHLCEEKRLNQEWFRRRIAWQAVSDFIADSEKCMGNRHTAWLETKKFLASCSPSNRTLRALAQFEADPDRFNWQLGAIYNATLSMLAGVSDQDG